MKIRLTVEEMISSKFARTIKCVEGVYQEAKGDVETGQTYAASGVKSRIEDIREALYKDIKLLINSIDVEGEVIVEKIADQISNFKNDVSVTETGEVTIAVGNQRAGEKIVHSEQTL